MAEMHKRGQRGSVVSLICDGGDRYQHTYYDQQWLTENGYQLEGELNRLDAFYHHGEFAVAL